MSEPIDIQTLRAAALTSEELLARVTAEMRELDTHGVGMRLDIGCPTALAVVACVQLALRHPQAAAGDSAAFARHFIKLVSAKFEPNAPAIALAIERGNDPQHDTPREPEPPAENEERQRIIARRVEDLQKRGEPVNRVTLANELMKNGELQAIGGLSYLVTLYEPAPQIEQEAKVEDGADLAACLDLLAPSDPRMDGLIDRGRGLMEFILAEETPPTAEDIVAFMDSRRDPAPAVLTCPYCGHSERAMFEKVAVYICPKCGRTVETE